MNKYIFFTLPILLLLAGCHRPTTSELCTELQRAEALMYPNPDSALHILQAMDVPGNELNRATWALFTTQAKYKLSINQSDTLIHIANEYFIKSNNSQRKALVLYYKAVLEQEKKEIEKAQYHLLDAIQEVEKTSDYQLAHLIYAALGEIYIYRSLSNNALEAYTKAFDYAQKAQNIQQIIASLMYLGRTYGTIGKTNESCDSYQKAIEVAFENNEHRLHLMAVNELATIYNKMKDHKLALKYIKKGIELSDKYGFKINTQQYLTLGKTYNYLAKEDSAELYLKKASFSHNVYTAREAFMLLFKIQKENGRYKEATDNIEKSWLHHDSILKIDQSRTLIEMQEKYDQQIVKDEAAMEIRLQKQRTQMYIGIIIVVVLLAGVYARHRYRQRIARLAEAEERIDTLSRMLEEAQQATNEDDAFVKRMLLQQLGVIRLVANTPTAQNQALLRRLSELGNDQVPVEELIVWEDLYPLIDRLYNRFHTRLKERYGSLLTDKEMQTCCLLCAGFSTKEIGVITHQSDSSIYVRKTSIRKKIGAEEGADIVGFVNEEK